ncbi:hypothetical protein GARC_2120 [Paraglaciecola arctica BSs20135]|uniref:Uncharacterized protein n=1 Tax=Paraglaciecola arctica BSs20135 TaxID=493475 RepID=K6YLP6_9ALTE|nr:hypothetical protein GARC_2120 [Paraglaciecola arctica BSs20135]
MVLLCKTSKYHVKQRVKFMCQLQAIENYSFLKSTYTQNNLKNQINTKINLNEP